MIPEGHGGFIYKLNFNEEYQVNFFQTFYRITYVEVGSAISLLIFMDRIIQFFLWKKYKNWLGERIQDHEGKER